MSDIVRIGDATLIWSDCRDVLSTLPKFDLLLTDPPYGIGIAANPVRQKHAKQDWDAVPPTPALIASLVDGAEVSIIWGGNYFGLPAAQCFLVWDKVQPHDFSLAMCEQAWTNKGGVAKMHRQSVLSYRKEHPTQKPVELMAWCLDQVPTARTVLDPFMGSGTTGVACAQSGRAFTGIERERKYFDIACERIERAYAQGKLFQPEPAKPEQQEIAA